MSVFHHVQVRPCPSAAVSQETKLFRVRLVRVLGDARAVAAFLTVSMGNARFVFVLLSQLQFVLCVYMCYHFPIHCQYI